MEKIKKEFISEFVSEEKKEYKWGLGKIIASSLSGFIAGLIIASLFFYTLFDLTWKAKTGLGLD
ncbi:MAG: hypothetical protein ACOX0H_01070 [Patescibacteria group bacterium]|jgi:hypothetical protein|nr:hypothetical protein [bacterium]HQC49549.1 hypothetical protein [bacterium]